MILIVDRKLHCTEIVYNKLFLFESLVFTHSLDN